MTENNFWEHSWEDVSYHGSPVYQCDYCRVMKYDKEAKLSCPKAEKMLKAEAERKLSEERYEYERMKNQIKRFFYLKNKFEPKDD